MLAGEASPAAHGLSPLDYGVCADAALNALMTRWYRFGTGTWSGLRWWNSANALETIINYSFKRPLDSISAVIQDVYSNCKNKYYGNFITNFYDDDAWWALALVRAYDRTRVPEYLAMAETIFNVVQGAWDESTCSGGVWWNVTRREKNAIENELFITLSTRLYIRTGKKEYLDWARRTLDWFDGTGMQGPSGLINDGVDLSTCGSNHKTAWTYNQGVILGGLADLHTITGDYGYLAKARTIATAAMSNLVDGEGILREPCELTPEGCGADGPQFKGIFVRYLSYLCEWERKFLQSQSGSSTASSLGQDRDFISACNSFFAKQASSIWTNNRDASNDTLGLHWAGPLSAPDASTQSSALDALVAAIPQ